MWPFKKQKIKLPEEISVAAQVVANPPVFNPLPNDHEHSAYRADAIARDIEQRREEGRGPNVDHDKMVAEAMSHAWSLHGIGKWTQQDIDALKTRLNINTKGT